MRAAKQKEMGNKAAGIVALATGGGITAPKANAPKLKRGGKVHGCATGGRLDKPARRLKRADGGAVEDDDPDHSDHSILGSTLPAPEVASQPMPKGGYRYSLLGDKTIKESLDLGRKEQLDWERSKAAATDKSRSNSKRSKLPLPPRPRPANLLGD